jgi:hypothetical protein
MSHIKYYLPRLPPGAHALAAAEKCCVLKKVCVKELLLEGVLRTTAMAGGGGKPASGLSDSSHVVSADHLHFVLLESWASGEEVSPSVRKEVLRDVDSNEAQVFAPVSAQHPKSCID